MQLLHNKLLILTRAIILLPGIYILTLMWLIPEGEKYVPGLVALAFVSALPGSLSKHQHPQIRANQRPFLIALTSFTAYGLVTYFWKGDSWTTLRAFTAITLYAWLLSGQTFRKVHVQLLLLISGICLVVISAYQTTLGYDRLSGFINPIPFATALATLTLLIALITNSTSQRATKVIGATLVMTLFVAILLTQTRGVIVPIILIGMVGATYKLITSKMNLTAKIIIALFVSLTVFLSVITTVDKRIDHTLAEIQKIQSVDLSSSIGLRLQMWSASVKLVAEKPVFGHGDLHKTALEKLKTKGKIDDSLSRYSPSHYHNQYLDSLVKQGVVGLALLLLMVALGLRAAFLNPLAPKVWLPSVLVALVYASASFSDVPLRHPNTIYLFILAITILSGLDSSAPDSTKHLKRKRQKHQYLENEHD